MFGVRIRLKQYPELNFLKKEKKKLDKNVRTYIFYK